MRLGKIALALLTGMVAVVAIRGVRSRRRPMVRLSGQRRSRTGVWTFDHQFRAMPPGENLRIELANPAVVHWTVDQWDTAHDTRTGPKNGIHAAELPTAELKPGTRVQFTFFWPEVNRWEGEDFELRVEEGAARHAT